MTSNQSTSQSSIATTNETGNIAAMPTAPRAQTAKEVIAANVKLLIEQLEAGHSEGLTAYLTAMGRFHNYSFGNILEIARQRPDATRVAGLYAWNQLGRKVRKGQRGIRILAPMIGTRKRRTPKPSVAKTPQLPTHPSLSASRSLRVRRVPDRRRRASRFQRACQGGGRRVPRTVDRLHRCPGYRA